MNKQENALTPLEEIKKKKHTRCNLPRYSSDAIKKKRKESRLLSTAMVISGNKARNSRKKTQVNLKKKTIYKKRDNLKKSTHSFTVSSVRVAVQRGLGLRRRSSNRFDAAATVCWVPQRRRRPRCLRYPVSTLERNVSPSHAAAQR